MKSGPARLAASPVQVGDIVLVRLDPDVRRPMIVSRVGQIDCAPPAAREPQLQLRVSGTIVCEPEDHSTAAVRGLGQTGNDPARITGRPERHSPLVYAEYLQEGSGIGQWMPRSTNLPRRG